MHFRRHWRLGWKPTQAGMGWGLPSLAVTRSLSVHWVGGAHLSLCVSFSAPQLRVGELGHQRCTFTASFGCAVQPGACVTRGEELVGGCGCASFRLCAWQCIRECVRVSEASGADSARASYVWHRHGHVRDGRGGRPRGGGRCAALRKLDGQRWARARVRRLVRDLWFAACVGVCALGWLDWRWHARRWARECAVNWISKQVNLSRWV
jgi:hypothetical protein